MPRYYLFPLVFFPPLLLLSFLSFYPIASARSLPPEAALGHPAPHPFTRPIPPPSCAGTSCSLAPFCCSFGPRSGWLPLPLARLRLHCLIWVLFLLFDFAALPSFLASGTECAGPSIVSCLSTSSAPGAAWSSCRAGEDSGSLGACPAPSWAAGNDGSAAVGVAAAAHPVRGCPVCVGAAYGQCVSVCRCDSGCRCGTDCCTPVQRDNGYLGTPGFSWDLWVSLAYAREVPDLWMCHQPLGALLRPQERAHQCGPWQKKCLGDKGWSVPSPGTYLCA